MTLRQHHADLVAEYLERGGTIQRLPPPKPTVASDVLQYLQERNVDVHAIQDSGGTETNYVYKGQVINLKTLVSIANRHRSRRHLPPFQIDGSLH